MRNVVGKTLRQLRATLARMPASALPLATAVAGNQKRIMEVFEPLLSRRLSGLRIRTHGDLHLDQVLYTGKDFVFIDFSGVATETLVERRRKHSALRDVAGMLHSFQFAACLTLLDGSIVREEDRALAGPWAETWHRWVASAFLRAYLEATDGAAFMPTAEDLPLMLDTHFLERAFIVLRDELAREAWDTVVIPLQTIADRLGGLS